MNEKPEVYEKMKKLGLNNPFDPRAEDSTVDRLFVEEAAFDPDGNRFDLSTGMRDIETESAKRRAIGIQ